MNSMQVRQTQKKKLKTGLIELYSCQKPFIPPLQDMMTPVDCSSDIAQTTGTMSQKITDLTDGKR